MIKDLTRDTWEVFTETEEISIFGKITTNSVVKYYFKHKETDPYIKQLRPGYGIYRRYKFEKLTIKDKVKKT